MEIKKDEDFLEDLEKGFEKAEEEFDRLADQGRRTRRKARKSLKEYYHSVNDWILNNLVAVVVLIFAATALVVYLNPVVPKFDIDKVKQSIPSPMEVIKESKKRENDYQANLDRMEVRARVVIPLKNAYGEVVAQRFMVKRRLIRESGVSEFVTLKEPLEKLRYNKSEYDIYLKQQAEKAKEIK